MNTIRIEPYKRWSGGAKALANKCGILRATPKQVERHGDFDYIINWGNTTRRFNGEYVNKPSAVATACNKLHSAAVFGNFGIPQPDYTTDIEVARAWYEDGDTIVSRTLLRANSGRGIVLATKADGTKIARAPLYTKYTKKAKEYRVHVLGGRVIDVQMKKKRQEVPNEEVNYQIRNACNGWVFCRGGVDAPAVVTDAAVRAVSVLGLDFGAVDIGLNAKRDTVAVYEVNTAPGLEGTTLDNYYTAFLEVFPDLRAGIYRKRRNGQPLGARRV